MVTRHTAILLFGVDVNVSVVLGLQMHIAPSTWSQQLYTQLPVPRDLETLAILDAIHAITHKPRPGAPARGERRPINPNFKPECGFWTSSVRDDDRSDWQDFHDNNLARDSVDQAGFVFEVIASPAVLVLANNSDVDAALAAVGIVELDPPPSRTDQFWAMAAERYDAVHVPRSFKRWGYLYLWDVESTLWFRPDQFLNRTDSPNKDSRANPG